MAHAGKKLALQSRGPLHLSVLEFKLPIGRLQAFGEFLPLLLSALPFGNVNSDHEISGASSE